MPQATTTLKPARRTPYDSRDAAGLRNHRAASIEAVAGKNIEMNFTLEEQAMSLDEVVVSATRNETNRRRTATVVNVASQKLFESTASSNLSESMNFQSGLRVENNCGNCGTMQLRINGLEGHYSQILPRQPPHILVARGSIRTRPAARGHDRTRRSGTRRRLGALRLERHRRRCQHHNARPAAQLTYLGQHHAHTLRAARRTSIRLSTARS